MINILKINKGVKAWASLTSDRLLLVSYEKSFNYSVVKTVSFTPGCVITLLQRRWTVHTVLLVQSLIIKLRSTRFHFRAALDSQLTWDLEISTCVICHLWMELFPKYMAKVNCLKLERCFVIETISFKKRLSKQANSQIICPQITSEKHSIECLQIHDCYVEKCFQKFKMGYQDCLSLSYGL